MIKYSSIGQFRNVVQNINHNFEVSPTLVFRGTVKVHGTNAGVLINPDGTMSPQSRTSDLDTRNDNAGFANWLEGRKDAFTAYKAELVSENLVEVNDTIVIYAEWAGKGIQKSVAVNEVSKFFYCIGVRIATDPDPETGEISGGWIKDRPAFTDGTDIVDATTIWSEDIEIDFTSPGLVQNELIEITTAIEALCPVGQHFGVEGTGEGVVWEYITDYAKKYSFKVKGEKHSISKVKTLAPVDVEKLNSINEFVEYAVTENRLEQAFGEVCNNVPDRKHLGAFIKWMSSDIIKEESDVLAENKLSMKDVGKPLSVKARTWFFAKEEL